MEVHGTRCGFSPAGGSQSRSLAPRRGRAKSAYINIGGSRDTHRTHGITHGTHGKRKHRRRLARTAHDGAQNKRNHRSLSASTHARTTTSIHRVSETPDKAGEETFLPLAVCMASADHDVAGTFPADEDASSGSDELSKEKRWDRIRALRTTAAYSPQHKDHNFAIASGFGRYSRGFLGVLNLTLNRSELMKLAEEKQQELDERRGVTEDVFHKGRNEPALDSKREAWHDSFRSRRKQKVPANPAMLQALQTAHKIKENSFKEATEHQASLLLQGRFVSQEVPMDRKFNIRSRRLSGGQEIIQSAASLTKIWATKGTDDDKFRPENNAVRRSRGSCDCTCPQSLIFGLRCPERSRPVPGWLHSSDGT